MLSAAYRAATEHFSLHYRLGPHSQRAAMTGVVIRIMSGSSSTLPADRPATSFVFALLAGLAVDSGRARNIRVAVYPLPGVIQMPSTWRFMGSYK